MYIGQMRETVGRANIMLSVHPWFPFPHDEEQVFSPSGGGIDDNTCKLGETIKQSFFLPCAFGDCSTLPVVLLQTVRVRGRWS